MPFNLKSTPILAFLSNATSRTLLVQDIPTRRTLPQLTLPQLKYLIFCKEFEGFQSFEK
jgi:hypothetical protein